MAPQKDNIVMTLLNIRSLRKHHKDLKLDSCTMASDILLLTETQLYPNEPTDKLQQAFMPFQVHWQPHTLNSNCLAVLFSSNIQCISKRYIPSINALLISISKQPFQPMTILLVYRNLHEHQSQFLFHLRQILLTNTVHIVLGDFNMDFFTNDSNNLKQLMEGFCMYQTVSQPTCIPGASLLDHVYVAQPFLPIQHVHTATKSVYYSDHQAIRVPLTNVSQSKG